MLQTTENETPHHILLTGNRGIGKTVFIKKIQKEMENMVFWLFISIFHKQNVLEEKI